MAEWITYQGTADEWRPFCAIKDEKYGDEIRLTILSNVMIRYEFYVPQNTASIINCESEEEAQKKFNKIKPVLVELLDKLKKYGYIDHPLIEKYLGKYGAK